MTLNRTEAIDPGKVIRTIPYAHPVFTAEGQAAQARHDEISGRNRTHYCGAYWGWGFHEDGVVSARARRASARSGGRCDAQRALRGHDPPPPLRGARARVPPPDRAGLRRPRRAAASCSAGGSSRRAPGSCASAARDYLGDPAVPLADAVRALVARAHRARARRARSALLTHLRTFGHCFNPVSFYYCFDADGERSRRSSPRSPTRRGASATPTCCRAATARVLRGGSTRRCTSRRSWHGPALRLARARAGRDAVGAHREPRRTGARAFDATLGLQRRPLTRARWPLPPATPPRRCACWR